MSGTLDYFRGEPLEVGTDPQFLFDDHAVEDVWDLKRVSQIAAKFPGNPVMVPDQIRWLVPRRRPTAHAVGNGRRRLGGRAGQAGVGPLRVAEGGRRARLPAHARGADRWYESHAPSIASPGTGSGT